MVGYLQISVTILRMWQCLCFFICNVSFRRHCLNSDIAMSRHRGCVLVASNYTADPLHHCTVGNTNPSEP